jgi:glycosyltransferase involved in cell wall biosynthesis
MKLSVVTPFLNGIGLLPDYIAATPGAELILVDNGSDEETASALQELPEDRGVVIRNETNLGFAAANNQGYAKATGDIIVFLNSDVAGDPVWLKYVADDVQDGYLYGPSVQQQLVYGMWLPYIEGWCIAATRRTWDVLRILPSIPRGYEGAAVIFPDAGPWDQDAYPGPYWEDNDLCFRALEAGIGLIPTQWPIQHKGGRSAGPLTTHGDTFEANRATFAARVGAAWERMQAG